MSIQRNSHRPSTIFNKVIKNDIKDSSFFLTIIKLEQKGSKYYSLPYRPVIIKMSQFISKSLHVVWGKSRGVMDNIEMCGTNSSLTNRLAYQKEIIPNE